MPNRKRHGGLGTSSAPRARVPNALEYQTKPLPKEALPDGWCPFSCGAHVLFNIVADGIAECFAKSRLLDGNGQIENSLPRSGIAVFVHTREMAARCRNLGGMDWCVLDISFSRQTGSGRVIGSTVHHTDNRRRCTTRYNSDNQSSSLSHCTIDHSHRIRLRSCRRIRTRGGCPKG